MYILAIESLLGRGLDTVSGSHADSTSAEPGVHEVGRFDDAENLWHEVRVEDPLPEVMIERDRPNFLFDVSVAAPADPWLSPREVRRHSHRGHAWRKRIRPTGLAGSLYWLNRAIWSVCGPSTTKTYRSVARIVVAIVGSA